MDSKEVLEIYKKHERETRPDLAALIAIAEIMGVIHETLSDYLSDIAYEITKIRKVNEALADRDE